MVSYWASEVIHYHEKPNEHLKIDQLIQNQYNPYLNMECVRDFFKRYKSHQYL